MNRQLTPAQRDRLEALVTARYEAAYNAWTFHADHLAEIEDLNGTPPRYLERAERNARRRVNSLVRLSDACA